MEAFLKYLRSSPDAAGQMCQRRFLEKRRAYIEPIQMLYRRFNGDIKKVR
jgi:hypothetical protein